MFKFRNFSSSWCSSDSCWKEIQCIFFRCHLPFHWLHFFFGLWYVYMVGFPPHGTISSPTASTSVSHFEERETFGSSPADKKNMSGLCLAALGILANGLAVEGGHSAAGFPCKVGPRTLKRNLFWCHIFNCLHWGLTPPVSSQLFCFPSVKVTVSLTCKSPLDDPFGLGLRRVGTSSRAKLAVLERRPLPSKCSRHLNAALLLSARVMRT